LNNTACQTLKFINKDGTRVYKEKKKFKTFEDALIEARRLNTLPQTIHKFEAYKCKSCLRFHVGRTPKLLHPDLRYD
jgi:hypothetical protein